MGMRLAERRDLKPLAELLGELADRPMTEEEAENRLRFCENSPFDFLYVYEDGSEVLGVCAFRIRENIESVSRYGEVSAIVVHPGARRWGIGRIMMDFMQELAREKQCIGLWLVSGFGREEEAHTFYRNYGFQVMGNRFVKRF